MNFLDVINLSQCDPTLLVVLMTAGFIITFIFAVDSAMAFDSFIPFVVIMTIGKVRLCGTYMSFADMIPYLKPILQHLQEREIVEKSYILSTGGAAWLDNDPEWDAAVCEWKIRHRYQVLTETRTKRFLKEMGTNEAR